MLCKNGQLIEKLEKRLEFCQKNLLEYGRRMVPSLTPEDVLQPNDYPELEAHPEFRYLEGVVAGIQEAIALLRAEEAS